MKKKPSKIISFFILKQIFSLAIEQFMLEKVQNGVEGFPEIYFDDSLQAVLMFSRTSQRNQRSSLNASLGLLETVFKKI